MVRVSQSEPSSHCCPVCLGTRSRLHSKVDEVVFCRCERCSSLFSTTNGDPTELHPADYARRRGHGTDPSVIRAKQRTFDLHLKRLGRAQGRSLIEIGCSTGDGLLSARRLGWQVAGLEVNADAVVEGNKRFDGEIITHGSLETFEAEEASYDAAVLFDVLEHFADPRAAVTKLRFILRPGGELLIVTPNADSLSARLLGSRWPHLLPEHRTLFTAGSLRSLLHGHGFVVVDDGPATKHLSTSMFRRHVELYPHVFGARMTRWFTERLPEWSAPMFVGETYAVARVIAASH